MDDFLNQLNKQISSVTEKILSPQEMDALKRDVRRTMRAAGDVVREAGRAAGDAVRNAGQSFQNGGSQQTPGGGVYWNPPRSGGNGQNGASPQWNTFQARKPQSPPPRRPPQPRPFTPPSRQQPAFKSFGAQQRPAKRKDRTGSAWILSIIGGVLILSGLGSAIDAISYFSLWNLSGYVIDVAVNLIPVSAGTALMACGVGRIKYIKRYHRYREQLKGVDYASIADMAEFFAIPEAKLVKDLKRMMSDGLFQNCYFDEQETCFILSKEVYDQYLAMRENLKIQQAETERRRKIAEENPEAAALEEMRATGEEYIRKIRSLNDALPAQDISEKLDRLESICSQIFSYVGEHSEKLPQIRRFMSYYLPTTLKLTESYRDLEQRQISTDEVQSVKQEILETLDNINLAFQNLYKNLMQKDLMGLSADISALETMLTQEGLMDSELKMDTPENGRSFDL